MTTRPKIISNHFILFLRAKGSIRLVQNAVVAMPARQTDAVDTLAEAKNKIQ